MSQQQGTSDRRVGETAQPLSVQTIQTTAASTQTYQTPSSPLSSTSPMSSQQPPANPLPMPSSTAISASTSSSSPHTATTATSATAISTSSSSPSLQPSPTMSTPAHHQRPPVARPATAATTRTVASQGSNTESPGAPTIQPRRPRTAGTTTSSQLDENGIAINPAQNAPTSVPNNRTIAVSELQTHYMSPWDMHLSDAGPMTNRFNYYFARPSRSAGDNGVAHAIMQREFGDPRLHFIHDGVNGYIGGSNAGMQAPLHGNQTTSTAVVATGSNATNNMRPHFRTKIVCVLDCKHCNSEVCRRGMKAILLADMNVELFSTDAPPYSVQLVNEDYQTRNCYCRIRDVACLGCGNVIGYHVTQPCEPCMDACNNGHFWMFHVSEVMSRERMSDSGKQTLLWSQLPRPDKDTRSSSKLIEVAR